MGLFSKLRKSAPSANDTLAKAVLVPSVMTMISDGSVDDSELAQLANLCSFSPIFARQSPDTVLAMIKDVLGELQSSDIQAMIDRTKGQLTMPMRETAVLFAMRIAIADGRVDEGERKALLVLGQQFEIPESTFFVMFDVISMLQRAPESVSA
ncbi:tellurite resistance TerB family protein [Aliiroseovarius sp. YM-037]|uniref:tellurite resistance TerB family protein n=1 Tax=Aliiroseovarius sp. YM-037 TaxID=3341728 RepID=UPI003A800FE0